MAYKCLFMDNGVYNAQDVNDAISNIVYGGVSGYPFGSSALSDLNTAIAELSSGGVNYKGTSCLVVNDGGTYKISEGVCIMNDGSQIIFDANGYEITPEPGVKQYVYLERDVLHNTINVVVAGESGGQDTIPLAEISANGTIADRRRFAISKLSLSAEPENISIVRRIEHAPLLPGESFDYDIGFNGWKYLFCEVIKNYSREMYVIKMLDGEMGIVPYETIAEYDTGVVKVTRHGSILHFENITSQYASKSYNIEIEVR